MARKKLSKVKKPAVRGLVGAKRKKDGRFEKGKSGNPGGRKTSEFRLALEAAISQVEKDKGKSFLLHVVECAWTDVSLMKEVLKKLVPDLKQTDHQVQGDIKVILE